MKRKITVLAALLLMAALGLTVGCKDTGVKLVDFKNSTVEVEYGSSYTVDRDTVKDADGNEYPLTAVVKDSKGNEVFLLEGKFDCIDLGGYTVTYRADAGGKTTTATVTIVVKDTGKPVIDAFTLGMGFVGRKYVFPAVRVADNTGENITPSVTLALVEENGETPITLDVSDAGERSFTPAERGTYKLKIAAADASGNSVSAETPFYIRSDLGEGMLEDFDDPYAKANATNYAMKLTTVEPVWHQSFEGKTGVVEIDSGVQTYPNFAFRFDYDYETLRTLNFYRLNITLYVHTEKTSVKLYSRNEQFSPAVPGKTWTTMSLTKKQLFEGNSLCGLLNTVDRKPDEAPADCFARQMCREENGYKLFWGYVGNNVKVYVDSISYDLEYKPTVTTDPAASLGHDIALTAESGLADATYEFTVTDPDGEEVTPVDGKLPAEKTGAYTIVAKTLNDGVICGESDPYTVTVTSDYTIQIGTIAETYPLGSVTVPAVTILYKGNPVAEPGDDLTITVSRLAESYTVTNGAFTADKGGRYTVRYAYRVGTLTVSETADIKVAYPDARPAEEANEVESFDHPDSVNNIRPYQKDTIVPPAYLDDFAGAEGVVKSTLGLGAWPYLCLQPRQDMSVYEDYQYIVFRMYFEKDSCDSIKLGNNLTDENGKKLDTGPVDMPKGEGKFAYGEWKNYIFPIAPFLAAFKPFDAEDYSSKTARLWFHSGKKDGSIVFYIDDVYCLKSPLTASFEGDLKAGNTLTLKVKNPYDVTGYKMTVKDPDGTVMDIANGGTFKAAAGTYTVSIKYDDGGVAYYQDSTQEIVVADTVTFTALPYTGSPSAGAVVTLPGAKLTAGGAEVSAQVTQTVTYYGKAVTLDGGKFTATTGGKYAVVYETTYNGKKYTAEQTIEVARAAPAAGEIESFDCAAAQDGFDYTRELQSVEYLDDFKPADGTHGSLKYTLKTKTKYAYAGFNLKGRQDASAYAGFNKVRLRLYIESTGEYAVTSTEISFYANKDYNTVDVTVNTNEWVTVELDMSVFAERNAGTYWLWFNYGAAAAGDVPGHQFVQSIAFYDISAFTAAAEA